MKTLKRIKTSLLILHILLLVTLSLGNNAAWGTRLLGIGGSYCGVLLEQKNSGETRKDSSSGFYGIYTGYITGRNYERGCYKGKDISHESLFLSVVKYCRNNPRNKIIMQ